jgi:hypothetical protein
MSKEQILAGLEKAVVAGKKDEAKKMAHEALAHGVNALEAIDQGMIKGMNIVGDKYAAHEFFLPQVLLAADAMYGALDVLLPHIPKDQLDKQVKATIGVVEGDVHDIGKNIVKTMMTAAGFAVTDRRSGEVLGDRQAQRRWRPCHEHLDDPHHGRYEAGHGWTDRVRNEDEGQDHHRRSTDLQGVR